MTTENNNDTRSVYIVLFVLQFYALCGVIEEVNFINVVYLIVVVYGTIDFYISNRSV